MEGNEDNDYDAEFLENEDGTEVLCLRGREFKILRSQLIDFGRMCWGDSSEIHKGLYLGKWEVVLKVLPGLSLVERDRFDRQVRILKKARHYNILKFVGATDDDIVSSKIIVLELITGGVTLERYLSFRSNIEVMNLKKVVMMGIVVAAAMKFLHSQGIMHRNLKLSNILVTRDCNLKLTGFSNAREVIDDEEEIEPVIEDLAIRGIAKTRNKQNDLTTLDAYCFGQLLYKMIKGITRTDPKKRMNPNDPLYLSSTEKERPSMEDIPEIVVEILEYCLEGQANFTLIKLSLETILDQLNEEEQSQQLTTNTVDSQHSGDLKDRVLIDLSDIKQGPMVTNTPSATFHKAKYQGRYVLLKTFKPSKTWHGKRARMQAFDREVATHSRLEHNNIVQFVGSWDKKGLFVVTELMEGGTLEKYLSDLGSPPVFSTAVLIFALGISRAMQYVHSKGIIHCDLKPSNVFLSKDKDFVKIGGFENARDEKDLIKGKEASSSKNYGRTSDVFNFARILWQLMINRPADEFEDFVSTAEFKPELKREDVEFESEIRMFLAWCVNEEEARRPDFLVISMMLENLLQCISDKAKKDAFREERLKKLNEWTKKQERKDKRKRVVHKVLYWVGLRSRPRPLPRPRPGTQRKKKRNIVIRVWACLNRPVIPIPCSRPPYRPPPYRRPTRR